MQMKMRNQVILTSLHWKSRQNIHSWSRRNRRVTCPLISSCSCGCLFFFCGGRTSLVGRANPSPHWVRGRVTSQSHNDWQPPIDQLCKHRRAGIGTQNLQIPWNCSTGSFGLWISVGFIVVCCNCRILECFVFGAATCSQPLASSGVAGRKTPISAAAALPVEQMSEAWQRWELHKARYAELWTSCEKSNFQQLFFPPPESNPKHAAKNTTVLSFSLHLLLFQSLVYTSSTLVCSRQLEERAVSAGVSMATGMRLISKVRVKTPGGAQGRSCLPLWRFAAEPRCCPPPRSNLLQQAC